MNTFPEATTITPTEHIPAFPKSIHRIRAFSLVELMVVMAIISSLLYFVGPAVSGILKGKKIEQGINTVTGMLDAARMEAMTQNCYVWVGFRNMIPQFSLSGQDELWIANFKVTTPGGRRLPTSSTGGTATPVNDPVRVEGVNMVTSEKLPEKLKGLIPNPSRDLASTDESATGIKWSSKGTPEATEYKRLILFTPRGEAIWETGNSEMPDPEPNISIALAQTVNGIPVSSIKDAGLLIVSGYTGKTVSYRP